MFYNMLASVCVPLQAVAILIFGKITIEFRFMTVLDIVQIFMRIKLIQSQLNHGNRDIGTVVCNPLIIGQQIVKYKAVIQGAVAGLDPFDMFDLNFIAKIVNDFFQRFYPSCKGKIVTTISATADANTSNSAFAEAENSNFFSWISRAVSERFTA